MDAINEREVTIVDSLNQAKLAKQEVPGWLNFEPAELKAKVLHAPKIDDLKTNFNLQMIVEYYSR